MNFESFAFGFLLGLLPGSLCLWWAIRLLRAGGRIVDEAMAAQAQQAIAIRAIRAELEKLQGEAQAMALRHLGDDDGSGIGRPAARH